MYRSLFLLFLCSSVGIYGSQLVRATSDVTDKKRPECITRFDTGLCKAARDGDAARIEPLLELGAAINNGAQGYNPPLIEASRNEHTAFVKVLLAQEGVQVDIQSDQWSALHITSYYRYSDIVQALVDKGADLYALNGNDHSPLFLAASKKHFNIVKLLAPHLDNKKCQADLDFVLLAVIQSQAPLDVIETLLDAGANACMKGPKEQETPLHAASRNGNLPVVQLLLARGAQVNVRRTSGTTPLRTACRGEFLEIIRELVANGDRHDMQSDLDSILLDTVKGNTSLPVIKELVAAGANPSAKEKETLETPLYAAIRNGADQVINVLLASDAADVHAMNQAGESPLRLACRSGKMSSVKAVISSIDKRVCQADLNSILFEMIDTESSLQIIQELLNAGADPATQEADSHETPLHKAARKGVLGIVTELLDHATGTALNGSAGQVIRVACEGGHVQVAQVLAARLYKNASQEQLVAALVALINTSTSFVVLKELLDIGVKVEGSHGETLLNMAVKQGALEFVQEFLKRGAGASLSARLRMGLVHLACHNSHAGIVRVLVKHLHTAECPLNLNGVLFQMIRMGATLEVIQALLDGGADYSVQEEGSLTTPLHIAAHKRAIPIIKELITRGAKVNAPDKSGTTPLHVGCCVGRFLVVKALVAGIDRTECQDDLDSILLDRVKKKGARVIIEQLLTAGADPNKQQEDSLETSVHAAVQNEDIEVLRVLLANEAHVHVLSSTGITPLRLACHKGNGAIIKMLALRIDKSESQDDLNSILFEMIATESSIKIIQELLNTGADPAAQEADTLETPLHKAAQKGALELVEELLAKDVDVNARSSVGITPLHLACGEGHAAVIKSLVTHKADTQIKDVNGKRPLDYWLEKGCKLLKSESEMADLAKILRKGRLPSDLNLNKYHSLGLFAAGCVFTVCVFLGWKKYASTSDV